MRLKGDAWSCRGVYRYYMHTNWCPSFWPLRAAGEAVVPFLPPGKCAVPRASDLIRLR
jgi:hypothetical protein